MKDSPFLVIHMIVANFLMLISQWSLLHKHAYNIDSLRPSDAIWWHRSRSTLAQVMACCLMAPSHYRNQCWLIFSKVQWHPLEGNCTKIAQSLITKINNLKFHSNLPVDNELKYIFRPWQHCEISCKLSCYIETVHGHVTASGIFRAHVVDKNSVTHSPREWHSMAAYYMCNCGQNFW